MFSRVKNTDNKSKIPSIISCGLSIKGDIISDGELQIDGKVEGDIKCQEITIGILGSIKGEVVAESIKIYGSLNGIVLAKNVLLGSTAKVIGDITHESLAIEPGAYIEGHCVRSNNPPILVKEKPKQEKHEKELAKEASGK